MIWSYRRGLLRLGLWVLVISLITVPTALAVPGGPDPDGDLRSADSGVNPPGGTDPFTTLNGFGAGAGLAPVNDTSLDNFQTFPGARPAVHAIESETSVASAGQNVVVVYNSSAGDVYAHAPEGGAYFDASQWLPEGYSVSHDGGGTWTSGFFPAAPDSYIGSTPVTISDPTVAVDRRGNFYAVHINYPGLQLDKSTDGGRTWTVSTFSTDFYSDKPWLTIGPDPTAPWRDNLYVTWTHFSTDYRSSQLWMERSTDGGATWSAPQVVFVPPAGGVNSPNVQGSNPVVDPITGRLYIPFLNYSTISADNIRAVVSDDGGQTFRPVSFNVPGAPDPTSFPNVTPGSETDCGIDGGTQLTIHEGSATVGRRGRPRWVQATRIIDQPATAASHGRLFIALPSSTSPIYGAGTGSEIKLLYSPDGGATWAPPAIVVPSTPESVQHFNPAITVDPSGRHVSIVYYTQGANGQVWAESVSGDIGPDGVSFGQPTALSTPFDLSPTNITIDASTTSSYDSSANPCYGLGEYMGVTDAPAGPLAAWAGDLRTFTEPPGAIIAGTHPQEDVYLSQLPGGASSHTERVR